jgi:hypothetical protein
MYPARGFICPGQAKAGEVSTPFHNGLREHNKATNRV